MIRISTGIGDGRGVPAGNPARSKMYAMPAAKQNTDVAKTPFCSSFAMSQAGKPSIGLENVRYTYLPNPHTNTVAPNSTIGSNRLLSLRQSNGKSAIQDAKRSKTVCEIVDPTISPV